MNNYKHTLSVICSIRAIVPVVKCSSLPPRSHPVSGSRFPTSKPTARSNVLEQLQLLEEQLSAIESTARTVEGEFKSSNQVREEKDV